MCYFSFKASADLEIEGDTNEEEDYGITPWNDDQVSEQSVDEAGALGDAHCAVKKIIQDSALVADGCKLQHTTLSDFVEYCDSKYFGEDGKNTLYGEKCMHCNREMRDKKKKGAVEFVMPMAEAPVKVCLGFSKEQCKCCVCNSCFCSGKIDCSKRLRKKPKRGA